MFVVYIIPELVFVKLNFGAFTYEIIFTRLQSGKAHVLYPTAVG